MEKLKESGLWPKAEYICKTLNDYGYRALVAGGADDASISLAADEDSLDSMIATLQEKGII